VVAGVDGSPVVDVAVWRWWLWYGGVDGGVVVVASVVASRPPRGGGGGLRWGRTTIALRWARGAKSVGLFCLFYSFPIMFADS
jgi:hypothetical protein